MSALWSERQNCSHNVSQKVKHIRRVSDESGTGTAGTVIQEPKPEPEPSFPVKLY